MCYGTETVRDKQAEAPHGTINTIRFDEGSNESGFV